MIQFGCDIAAKIFPDFKYGWLADEFKARLPAELDFELEAENTKRCGEIFKGNKNVAVPKVYDQYTHQRVLTMSFETGLPLTKVREM